MYFCRVFSFDVCGPELVKAGAGKISFEEVTGDVLRLRVAPLRPPDRTNDGGLAHQHRDRPVTHHNATSEGELSVDPPPAVGATRLGVNVADQTVRHAWRVARSDGARPRHSCSPTLTPPPRGRRPGPGAPGGHHRDRREPSLRSLLTRSNSIARREIASSVSNLAISFFAATISAFFRLDRPGTKPRSIRS